jgi:hypothetical protein
MLGETSAFDLIYKTNLEESFELVNTFLTHTVKIILKDVSELETIDSYRKSSSVYKFIVRDGSDNLAVHLLTEAK